MIIHQNYKKHDVTRRLFIYIIYVYMYINIQRCRVYMFERVQISGSTGPVLKNYFRVR